MIIIRSLKGGKRTVVSGTVQLQINDRKYRRSLPGSQFCSAGSPCSATYGGVPGIRFHAAASTPLRACGCSAFRDVKSFSKLSYAVIEESGRTEAGEPLTAVTVRTESIDDKNHSRGGSVVWCSMRGVTPGGSHPQKRNCLSPSLFSHSLPALSFRSFHLFFRQKDQPVSY